MTEKSNGLTYKDFSSSQEVRWCPGCDDYVILRAVQMAMPEIGAKKEDIVFVSGIGCSSRFPYYMNTYGFHSIHGRAPALATGLKLANPDLHVWQITGDGDALAIGGNHFIHQLRRNVDINVLLFNNEIYGLTKGQFSPTSNLSLKTKSSPHGNLHKPFNIGDLVLGAGGTFFARAPGGNPKYMKQLFIDSSKHKGTSMIEIFQNCVIFNDGVFDDFLNKKVGDDTLLFLEHGKPMIFGKELNKGIVVDGLKLKVVTIGENGVELDDILVHDAYCNETIVHHMLVQMSYPDFPVAMGIIRQVSELTFEDRVSHVISQIKAKSKFTCVDDLLYSGETWKI